MRVLCSDLDPVLPYNAHSQDVAGQAPESEPRGRVRLSWMPTFDALGVQPGAMTSDWMNIAVVQVSVDDSDAFFHLYRDCLQYLREAYPVGTWCCETIDALSVQTLGLCPASFSTLINVLADVLDDSVTHGLGISRRSMSHPVAAFVLSGALFDWEWRERYGVRCHVACAVSASRRAERLGGDLCQALFLDCFKAHLCRENWRRHHAAEESLMPWSRQSKQEVEETVAPDSTGTAVVEVEDLWENLPDEHGETMRVVWSALWPPTIDVPWLGARHDGYPFSPTLGAYTAIRRRRGVLHTLRDDAALWLSAMTFGLLEAVTRIRIPERTFLVPAGPHTNGAVTALSGKRVSQFLAYCVQSSSTFGWRLQGGEGPPAERGREVARLLRRAAVALSQEHTYHGNLLTLAGFDTAERDSICSAVVLAVLFPLCVICATLWPEDAEIDHLNDLLHGEWPSPSPIEFVLRSCMADLQRTGWCPYTVSHLTQAFGNAPNRVKLKYAGSILPRLSPYVRNGPGEHAQCTEDACLLQTFADHNYKLRHTHSGCRCSLVKPPVEDVRRLLSDGRIPVVKYDGMALEVLPSTDTPYVAISHVWAEGMGSTTEEGLPTCVVRRIATAVQRLLPSDGPFWMDSLCVPQEVTARKRAIKLMAQTYRDAAMVLVIDDCIRTQCSDSHSLEVNVLRIAASAWLRRVWTLQEGLLARKLYFEFVEGPVEFEEKFGGDKEPRADGDEGTKNVWLNATVRALIPLLDIRMSEKTSHNLPLWKLVDLLNGRKTSKAEDELIAVSSLLPPSITVDELLASSGPEAAAMRMRSFLLQLREVPRMLPFSRAPRLSLEGFTWAPRTLADDPMGLWITLVHGTGLCTENGLVAKYFAAPISGRSPVAALPYPVTGKDSVRPWRIRAWIYHHPSATSHSLFAWLESPCVSPIDALLFLGDFSATEHFDGGHALTGRTERACVAVCNVSEIETAASSADYPEDTHRNLRYVACCTLVKWEEQHTRFSDEHSDGKWSTLGELRETWVRLV
ncbi:hypothetical protein BD414DRAFT_488219 [Trametes punicea]|nr:hypothetical protein BD414DRAFT_488219 [Trametes punicea]